MPVLEEATDKTRHLRVVLVTDEEGQGTLRAYVRGRRVNDFALGLVVSSYTQAPLLRNEDLNGDGEKDLVVTTSVAGNGQDYQDVFLWSAPLGRFVASPEVSGLGEILVTRKGCLEALSLHNGRMTAVSHKFCWNKRHQRWQAGRVERRGVSP